MKPFRLILLFAILPLFSFAQIDTSALKVIGYVETTYFNDLAENEGFRLSHALFQVDYSKGMTSIHIGLQAGAFSNMNYPNGYEWLNEAYLKLALNRSNTLSISAGFFPSHLGFESVIRADNYLTTHSMASQYSPYFLLGSKIDYQPNEKINLGFVASNGWDGIYRANTQKGLALGSYLSITPNDNFEIYWATFSQNHDERLLEENRYFNNFFVRYNSKIVSIIAGCDYGRDKNRNGRIDYWYVPTGIIKITPLKKLNLSFRYEYFFDEMNSIITTPLPYPTNTSITGFSFNVDYKISSLVLFRIESRNLLANYEYFPINNALAKNYNNITASISARF